MCERKQPQRNHSDRTRSEPLAILYEDNHVIVIDKPPLLATMGAAPDRPSLVAMLKSYLKREYNKPGNVYLGVVSRLDAFVSGVVVFAKTSKAASRLTKQFKLRQVEKTYWAIVQGAPREPHGTWRHQIWKDDTARRMRVAREADSGGSPPQHPAGAQQAILHFRLLRRLQADASLLQIELETGRKHQIRAQLSGEGLPIMGDRKYGSSVPFPAGIALHATQLRFEHPVGKKPLDISSSPPAAWRRFLS